MSEATITTALLVIFLTIFVLISVVASLKQRNTGDDFFLAGRSLGPFVLMLTIGATAFSTWTLLGALGEYYRNGVWFFAFTAWAVLQGLFIWLFGARIWQLSRRYGFITPGDMAEHYYGSPLLRRLFAVFGIVGLVPYMLIQVTGGAQAISTVTQNSIPYGYGVIILGVLVSLLVVLAGGRGAAWGDTMMGGFFAVVLVGSAIYIINLAGGLDGFKHVAVAGERFVIVQDELGIIIDTALGFLLALWIMPQAWQKFCSAKSAHSVTVAAAATPFWNSWLMALTAGIIGLLSRVPGVNPWLTDETGDQALPQLFLANAPAMAAVVVVGIIAAGMSTINSQLLSSSSVFTRDIYSRFVNPSATPRREAVVGRYVIAVLTVVVVFIAFLPAAQGYIIPLANNGLAILSQLAPAALGPLVWSRATRSGAISSVLAGEAAVVLIILFGSPVPYFGATSIGLFVGLVAFFTVSLATQNEIGKVQKEYHDFLKAALYGSPDDQYKSFTK